MSFVLLCYVGNNVYIKSDNRRSSFELSSLDSLVFSKADALLVTAAAAKISCGKLRDNDIGKLKECNYRETPKEDEEAKRKKKHVRRQERKKG